MPIAGMTRFDAPSAGRIGTLRKGEERIEGSKRPGLDMKRFRFTAMTKDAYGARMVATWNALHDTGLDIPIFFPFETPEENFDAWREHRNATSLLHRCDGNVIYVPGSDGVSWVPTRDPCPHKHLPDERGIERCHPKGRLYVIQDRLSAAGFYGTTWVLTSSKWDIIDISGALADFYQKTGDLRGVPFILTREPRTIPTPRGDKRVLAEKWFIKLRAEEDWIAGRLKEQKRRALARAVEQHLLPAPALDQQLTMMCSDCGQEIAPAFGYPAEEVAARSIGRFLRSLCGRCSVLAARAEEAAQEEEEDIEGHILSDEEIALLNMHPGSPDSLAARK